MNKENTNVDNTKKYEVNAVEWFFGYGGNHMGLKRAIPGLRLRAVCEREGFVVANMVSKMEKGLLDAVPIWTDVKTFPSEPFKDRIDLFIASYPCQAFSHAGKRLGKEDPRHLWPYVRKFVQSARPSFCLFENVEGHVSLGLSTVLSDLEEDGYETSWGIFSAAEVGAPHQRKRVFILAKNKELADGNQLGCVQLKCAARHRSELSEDRNPWPSRPGETQQDWEPPRVLGNTSGKGLEGQRNDTAPVHRKDERIQLGATASNEGRGYRRGETQPTMDRDANGPTGGMDYAELSRSVDNRTDELRMCGNGVVPATAELAFRTLYKELAHTRPIRQEKCEEQATGVK